MASSGQHRGLGSRGHGNDPDHRGARYRRRTRALRWHGVRPISILAIGALVAAIVVASPAAAAPRAKARDGPAPVHRRADQDDSRVAPGRLHRPAPAP